MGLTAINPVRYGQLLAKTQPKVIETEREFESMVAQLGGFQFSVAARAFFASGTRGAGLFHTI